MDIKDRENLLSGYGETNNPLPAYYVIETSLENAKKIDVETCKRPINLNFFNPLSTPSIKGCNINNGRSKPKIRKNGIKFAE